MMDERTRKYKEFYDKATIEANKLMMYFGRWDRNRPNKQVVIHLLFLDLLAEKREMDRAENAAIYQGQKIIAAAQKEEPKKIELDPVMLEVVDIPQDDYGAPRYE